MQRIERYGVIALVFLLVTILAVAVWGQRKNQSLLSFLKRDKPAETAKLDEPTTGATAPAEGLGLSQPSHELSQLSNQPGTAGAVTDATTQLIPIGGPGSNAVTFDQGTLLNPLPKTNSGFINEPPARVLSGPGYVEPIGGSASVVSNLPRSYTVKRGDTLGSIAQRELGSSKRWPEIEALNGVKPERLSVGMVLKLPVAGASLEPHTLVRQDAVRAPAPAPTTSRSSYSVRSGDSLSKIAASQLGDANRYGEILALNPGLNPQRLNVGQSLRMPSDAKASSVASKPKPRAVSSKTSEVARADAPKKARVQ